MGKGERVKALTWHGTRDVRVTDVPDPTIQEPTDAIIRVTSSGLCGSDLHLYEVMGAFIDPGSILGHEPIGIVEEVGSGVEALKPGDRVVVPFNISCGHCWMCRQGLQSQCETTQCCYEGTDYGAALFGYTRIYGNVPGAQAEYLRVPQAQYGPIKVPEGPADDRFLFLSDVLPTAWQAVHSCGAVEGQSVAVIGLGPIGDMSCRVAFERGAAKVFGIDLVPERLERAATRGVEALDLTEVDDVAGVIRERTRGRGADAVIDAVGMEAHGSPVGKTAQRMAGFLPDRLQEKLMQKAGVDRLAALHLAIDVVRRGGTLSLVGVYGGMVDPLPMMTMFDKQLQLRMGQANVRRWVDHIIPLLIDDDPLGVDTFATHHLPLVEAPDAYATFQKKDDGMIKAVFHP
jgi:threonine dehydrogenase-like Zn-dependent dehydrogenase